MGIRARGHPATGTNPALPGPGGLARALNGAYIQAGITGILVWPLIDAIPPGLPHENRGLVLADLPWNGYYYVTPLTWVIAQTTQFTAPGWRHAAGADGDLPAGGSYDTYLAPGRSAWSMVAQTSVATAAQQVTIHVTGGLPARVVHVWSTNLRGPGQFIQRGDIIPHKGAFAALLQPGYIYSFTHDHRAVTGGRPPTPVPSRRADAGAVHRHPRQRRHGEYARPDRRVVRVRAWRADPDGGGGARGMAVPRPVTRPVRDRWPEHLARLHRLGPRHPPGAGTARSVPGARRHAYRTVPRVPGDHRQPVPRLRAEDPQHGAWQMVASGPAAVTLASGSVTAARAYTLSLTTRGTTISAQINGVPVAAVTNRMYRYGPAGLGSLGYYPVLYPSFTVR